MEVLQYSNLNNIINIEEFLNSKFICFLNNMSSYLPCVVNMNIFLSQITSAIAKPVTKNSFLKAYIDWNNVPYNNILLQPFRANFQFELKLPNPEILLERLLGINKITSLKVMKNNNIIYKNEAEGIDINCSFEPIVLNVDSNTLTLLNQLYNIIFDFSNYILKLCAPKNKDANELLMINSFNDNLYDNFTEYMMSDDFYFNLNESSLLSTSLSRSTSLSLSSFELNNKYKLKNIQSNNELLYTSKNTHKFQMNNEDDDNMLVNFKLNYNNHNPVNKINNIDENIIPIDAEAPMVEHIEQSELQVKKK